VRRHCVPRLFRSFLNFFVGESRWQEIQNTLAPTARDRYHRMNLEFHDEEPELDDLGAMSRLQKQVYQEATTNKRIAFCADNILASLFYYELDARPTLDNGIFTCRGQVRCRLGSSHKALRVLVSRLRETNSRFYLNFNHSVPCVEESSYQSIEQGGAYVCPITFFIMSLDEEIDIKIGTFAKSARSISNFPYKVIDLIEDEDLNCPFGHHKGNKRITGSTDPIAKRVKFVQ
jgi:hypothetical protein